MLKVFDTETTIKNIGENAIGSFGASPWHKDNHIVLAGYTDKTGYHLPALGEKWWEGATLLVGQNIRFDLWYMRKLWGDTFDEWTYQPGHRIWDTQVVEYLLEGQNPNGNSLQELSKKYGGEGKIDVVGKLFNLNIGSDHIEELNSETLVALVAEMDVEVAEELAEELTKFDSPLEMLKAYLKLDVEETERVYKGQIRRAKAMNMLPLIEGQMEGLLATYDMGWNGMCFDKEQAQEEAVRLKKQLVDIEARIVVALRSSHNKAAPGSVMAGSNDYISRHLFGGKYTYKVDAPVMKDGEQVLYKSGPREGQVKTRKEEREARVKKLYKPDKKWKTKKDGIYQVGDDVLKILLEDDPGNAFIEDILAFRELSKSITTYYEGYSALAWPKEDGKHYIHGNLNHTVTRTGRLSSSSPNLQNLSGKEN